MRRCRKAVSEAGVASRQSQEASGELALVVVAAGQLHQGVRVEHGEDDFHRVQMSLELRSPGFHCLISEAASGRFHRP